MKKFITLGAFLLVLQLQAQQAQVSLTLEEAIALALQNNHEMQVADLEIEKAKKKIWETTAIGLPQVSASVDYNYNLNVPVAVFMDQVIELGARQSLSAVVQANQLLFNGSYFVGLQSARAFAKISDLAKRKTETSITQAVIASYSMVVIADENLNIIDRNIQNSGKILHDVTEIYRAGFTEEQNVEQQSFSLNRLRASRTVAERQRDMGLLGLKTLLNIDPETDLVLLSDLETLMLDNLSPMGATYNVALEQHIDYQMADHQVTINELQVKYQKSMALPQLSTFFRHGENNFSQDGKIFMGFQEFFPSTVWGLQLNIPIFSSFQRRAITQQAEIDLDIAKVRRDQVQKQMEQDIRSRQLEYDSALDNYYVIRELVELSQRIYDKEQIKYFEGLSSSMDLTNTENQLFQAQNDLIQVSLQLMNAKNELYQAIGRY